MTGGWSGAAASAAIRPEQRHAWHGPALLVANARGECGPGDPSSGFFFRETRFLRELVLEVNGQRPWLCAAGGAAQDELAFVFVHPEVQHLGGGGSGAADDEIVRDEHGLPSRALCLALRYRLRFDALDVSLDVGNHGQEPVRAELAWRVGADYADLVEATVDRRTQTAPVAADVTGTLLQFRYAHPELPLGTEVAPSGPAEWLVAPDRIAARVTLQPQERRVLRLRIRARDAEPMPDADGIEQRDARLRAWRESLTRVDVPGDRTLERLVAQGMDDLGSLALLEGEPDEWLATAAGIPLYPALFGRDAVTAGWQCAALDGGQLLEGALARLRRLQGTQVEPARDEEPGRLVQQVRRGPLARLGLSPFARYYGDVASPLMSVISLGHLYAWRGERACLEPHWDMARRVLDWARELGDRDGDGYLEYETRSPQGPTHQGWKDSGGAMPYEDGRPVPTPLAACEIQGYWFAAQQIMAALSAVMGEPGEAVALWRSAMALKERFNRDFWLEDEGFVALALDPDKRPVRSIASNAGHCLASGIVDGAHVPRVVGRLFAPDMFSGWGIRTLSARHPAYNPLSYHLGSVWAVENATIAFGLRRFGFDARALELTRALVDLAQLYPALRVPECVGGYARAELPHPGAYPRANAPQSWNQSAPPLLLHTILGLQPIASLHLLVVDPVLPSWLPEVTLHGLRLGRTTATLRFHRDAHGKSHADVLRHRGPIHLLRQPPVESRTAGIGDRFGALVESVLHH